MSNPNSFWPPWEIPLPLGETPSVLPFPTDILPPCLATFIGEAAAALDCAADFLGPPLRRPGDGQGGYPGAVGTARSGPWRDIYSG